MKCENKRPGFPKVTLKIPNKFEDELFEKMALDLIESQSYVLKTLNEMNLVMEHGTEQNYAMNKFQSISDAVSQIQKDVIPPIAKVYNQEKSKWIDDNPNNTAEIRRFREILILYIASDSLYQTSKSIDDVLNAWLNGDEVKKKIKMVPYEVILEKEMATWPSAIGKFDDWDSFLDNQLTPGHTRYSLPVAFLFSNPTLLSRYVGVKLIFTDFCENGQIVLGDKDDASTYQHINYLQENEYYKDCVKIASETELPTTPSSFSLLDIVVLLIVPVILFFCVLLLFSIFHAGFWKVLFSIIFICVFTYLNQDNYFFYLIRKLMPLKINTEKYNKAIDEIFSEIKEKDKNAVNKYSTL